MTQAGKDSGGGFLTGLDRSRVRESEKANFLAVALISAVVLGVAAGLWLPWQTWRIGGLTPLGDFAVVSLLGAAIWQLLAGQRPSLGRLATAGLAGCGALMLHEVLWRRSPGGLGVLHGIAVAVLLVHSLGLAGYRIYRERMGMGVLLTEESLLRLGFGSLVLIWFLIGLINAL